MVSRIDVIELSEDLRKIKVFDLEEIYDNSRSFLTYINSISNTERIDIKLRSIKNAEEKIKEMIQMLISKINPDLNDLIYLDNEQNDSYKKFIDCLSLVQNKIEDIKEKLVNSLSNRDFISSNKITNMLSIDSYSSYLKNVFNDIIYIPLRSAVLSLIKIEEPATTSIEKFKGLKGVVALKKDKNLFWYFVFSYMFRSSQFIGYLEKSKLTSPKLFDIKDIKKLIRSETKLIKNSETTNEESEESTKKSETSPKSETTENKKEEQDKETEEVLEPRNMYFPKVNGAQENIESINPDEEFLEEEQDYEESEEDEDV